MPASTETRGGALAQTSRPSDATIRRYGPYIDGAERQPASGDYFETQDPYSGESWALVARCTRTSESMTTRGSRTVSIMPSA